MERFENLVVGGGIGGLAVALGLARRGRRVHVLEKAAEFGEIGAGLQLAPNASWALDRLGVLEAVKRHAVFPQRIVWMDAQQGTQLTAMDLGAPFVERYGYPYLVMHRSDLLDEILAACRREPLVTLETSADVIAVEEGPDYACALHADGRRDAAALVIGADGLHSTVRRAVHDDGPPLCSEYVAYRGTIPIGEVSAHAGFDNVMLWTGPEMHLVQYPVRRGELFNQVAVFRSHRYTPDGDDWGTADELDAKFATGTELVRAAVQKMWRTRRWPMFDKLPVERWSLAHVTLLGDAAHPMLQYLAQGAAQALEDAVVLADAIADHADAATALAAYERERVPRTARVQTLARAWGDYWHVFPGAFKLSRDAFLTARDPADYGDADWFYGYRGPVAVTDAAPN